MDITAAVLAGGLSSRFPYDKTKLSIEGENIVLRIVRLLRGLFSEVIVVANQKDRVPDLGEDCIVDLYPQTGPLGAIYTALSFSKTPWIFVLAGDMPFMKMDYIEWLLEQIPQEADIVMPKDNMRYQPLCAFYKKTGMKVMEQNLHTGRHKILSILPEVSFQEIDVATFPEIHQNPYLFYNINTQEDWENYLRYKKESFFG